MTERYERALNRAKRNLTNTNNEIKKDYRTKDVDEDNLHIFKRVIEEIKTSYAEFSKARDEYEDVLEDASVESLSNEDEVMLTSSKKTLRILNAKVDKYVEERQRADEKQERERQLSDEKEMRVRRLAEELALKDRERADDRMLREKQLADELVIKQSEIESKERIELERIKQGTTKSTSQVLPNIITGTSNLPRIELKKFDGDVTKFSEFMDTFSALIDRRPDLKPNEKFEYLKTVTLGSVSNLLEGIRVTDQNYKIALKLLKETYGSKPVVVTKLYDELCELKPLSWKPEGLHEFFQSVEIKFKLLENEGCNLEQEILRTNVFRKLPTSLQGKLIDENGKDFTTKHIRDVINSEIRKYIVMNSLKPVGTTQCNDYSQHTNRYLSHSNRYPERRTAQPMNTNATPTTHSLLTKQSKHSQGCMFCNVSSHSSDDCTIPVFERKRILKGLCFLCLGNNHLFRQCEIKNTYKCVHCDCVGHHNRVLCPNKQRKGFPVGNWRDTRNTETYHSKGNNFLQKKDNHPPVASNEACIATSSREKHLTPANNISRSLYSTQELPTDFTPVSLTSQNNSSSLSLAKNYHVYLQSATILVKKKSTDRGVEARVVFDSGATASYITEGLVKKLGLKHDYSRDVNVYTFGESRPKSIPMHSTHVQLTDKTDRVYEVNVNQVPTIAGSVANKLYVPELIENLCRKYDLADRYLDKNNDQAYDILIGNDYYMTFMTNNTIQVNEHLYLIGSVFGFLLSGKVQCNINDNLNNDTTNLFVHLDRPLSHEHDLRLLWDLETLGIKENPSLTDDDLALRQFEISVVYKDKRYFVDFPWKDDRDVQSNYGLALGRLRSLVKRHKEDGILESCKTNFEEQLKLGILERVCSSPTSNDIYCHYLPYHVVVNNERETTKIRVVMDASAKQDRNKPSLNQLLYRGPVLLENLCSLLLRFRTHKFGIIGDLEKAFLNIGLNTSERDFTRILWLKDTERPITHDNLVVLRHTRIPFGVTSSPFLLTGVISTHLSKYDSDDMIKKLKQDIYVDNLVTGLNNESELLDFIKRSRKIFSDASLNLRAWATNCVHEGFDSLPPEIKGSKNIQSLLGIQWNTENDTLFLKSSVKIDKEKKVTKRVLLSVLSSFYDVMGLWSPVTVQLKTLIQRAWTNNKDWDNIISEEDRYLFLDIVDDLQTIPNYEIMRLLGTITQTTHIELHAFSDACMYSYGTAIYLRCVNGNDITCNLIFAKVRVSSKNMTLPRLELMGALVAYRSLIFINKSLNLVVNKVYVWSDSTCVLHWLHTRKLLPVFVKNRVNEIRSGELDITFKYIRTHLNPADLCRGQIGSTLVNNKLWWHGPSFLCHGENDWPVDNIDFGNVKLEAEISTEENSEIDLLAKTRSRNKPAPRPNDVDETEFSSFHQLINHTCIVRCSGNMRIPISKGDYTAVRVDWIKYLQGKYFQDTKFSLENGKKDSLSLNLGLELDGNGLIICKGRFVDLKIDSDNPFPILLPRKDHLTQIIVMDIHVKNCHLGTNQTLAALRNNYWLPSGRTEVKSILRLCKICQKFNCKPYETPEFSAYPNYRLNKNVSFTHSAVDYFGPLHVNDGGKATLTRSVWCLLFTCLTTRAVHFELVNSESSSDLLLAFRRFIARTGGCKSLLSDNAAQFHLLQKTFQHVYDDNTAHDIINENKIDFKFTPALSPWAGGCFERLISITKQCLRKMLGNLSLSMCQLNTLLTEIQHAINNRPLGYYGEEDFIITPNHFLGIKRDNFLPDVSSSNVPRNQGNVSTLVREWKKGNQYLEAFWSKWFAQYVQSLRERQDVRYKSGKGNQRVPKVGDVVLVRKPKCKNREMWPYGKIEKLYFGRDSKVRHVDVRLQNGFSVSRPVSWLYPFECCD